MKLSIIIPIYNVENYLTETLETVLNQTFKDFELILVDDGSTDGSGRICDNFAAQDNRICVIHKKNEGVSVSRNTGVQAAKGEYIGFVDSDDIIEPCMYELMINALEQYHCDIVQCEHDRNSELDNIKYEVTNENFEVNSGYKVVCDIFIKKGGRCTNILSLCSKIYKRELFKDIVFPPGKVYEDEARTYQLILKAEKVGELDIPLYHYVKRDNSIITGIEVHKCLDKAWALHDRMEFFRNKDEDLFIKSAKGYLNYLKCTYVEMYKGTVKYTNEDKTICKLLKNNYKDFIRLSDKYTRIYLFMIKYNIGIDWIIRNDFEPIQRFIRKARGGDYEKT